MLWIHKVVFFHLILVLLLMELVDNKRNTEYLQFYPLTMMSASLLKADSAIPALS